MRARKWIALALWLWTATAAAQTCGPALAAVDLAGQCRSSPTTMGALEVSPPLALPAPARGTITKLNTDPELETDPMAAPAVVSVTPYGSSGNDTSHAFNYPATVDPGDLLIAIAGSDGEVTFAWPAGWNEIADVENGTSDAGASGSAAWREAVGDEDGGTFTVTVSASQRVAAQVYRITGHVDPDTQPPQIATPTTGASTAPDPGSLTPTGGAKDYRWIAAAVVDRGLVTVTYPTNYADNQTATMSDNAGGAGVAVFSASRALNAESEDPGAFTTHDDQWIAFTIAVHPAAAGVTGTIANTLGAFTSAISGTTTIVGTISTTLGSFVSALTGTTTVRGTMAAVLGAFTSAMQGTSTVIGTITATLGNFIMNASGTVGTVVASAERVARRMLMFITRR